jgi:hypothetical protein
MIMRRPMQALAWQFWAINRGGWLLTLGAVPVCAILAQLIVRTTSVSEVVHVVSSLVMVSSMLLALALCDFTDRDPRGGFAGFPRRLFLVPMRTALLVLCPMLCAVAGLVGLYIAWAVLIIRPLGMQIEIAWPAVLLATVSVVFQTIIWSLSGFRVARIVVMCVAACMLTTVACLPLVLASSEWPPQSIELMNGLACCDFAAVSTVGIQRRGGARGWNILSFVTDAWSRAMRRQSKPFASEQRALFWMEWRRNGRILPSTVLFLLLLIIGPIGALNGHAADVTAWTALWLFLIPILLAAIIGKGFAKPDLWTLDLALSPFSSIRPITPADMIAAKIKCAVCGTLLAWGILLAVGPLWIGLAGNLHTLNQVGAFARQIYSQRSLNLISILTFVVGILLTFSFMINALWIGLCGQTRLFYSAASASILVFTTLAILIGCLVEDADWQAISLVRIVPWLPWVLAGLFLAKVWTAAWTVREILRRKLARHRTILAYACLWFVATGLLVGTAWILASQVPWIRNLLMLLAMLAIPLARIGAAPLALARNRHR